MHIQEFQQLRNGRNLVGFGVHGNLAQTDTIGRGPRAHQVQALQLAPSRPAQCLAVDSNLRKAQRFVQHMHPRAEAGLESLGVKPIEDALECVMRGNSVRQAQEPFQPIESVAAERLDLLPIVGTTNHSTDSDHNDVQELVSFPPIQARVFELTEILLNSEHGLGHASSP